MVYRQTLASNVTFHGVGLHSGRPACMSFVPADAGTGIVFVRTDAGGARVPATLDHVPSPPDMNLERSLTKN